MTVEELIEKLQKIKNKKSQVKMDTSSSGTLLYRNICGIQITEINKFIIIELVRE